MPIIVAFIALVLSVSVAAYNVRDRILPTRSASQSLNVTITPVTTQEFVSSTRIVSVKPEKAPPIPTSKNVTTSPVQVKISVTPKLLPLTTASPTSISDTQAPVFTSVGGPQDGSTVNFNSFCFPLMISDNIPSGITVRYSFDNSGVSDWKTEYAPCYQNVSNGFHFFVVQARDAAGNMSGTISRNFTVAVLVPTVDNPTPIPTGVFNEPAL